MGTKVVTPILVDGTKIPENANKTPVERINEFDSVIRLKAKEFAALPAVD
ncbi:azoreductase [Chlamydia trachomatis]|nr:azoreductase [Chlamydia trachomatis]